MKKELIYKFIPILLVCFSPNIIIAASKQPTTPYMDWALQNIILLLAIIVIIGVAITLWNLSMTMIEYSRQKALRNHGIEPSPKKDPNAPSWLSKMYDKAWSLVPVDNEDDIDLGHDYDGIRELDNNLPPWWLYGFYISIMVAVGYLYIYHFSDIGHNQIDEYEIAMKKGENQKAAYAARQTNSIDEKNLVALTDANAMEVGQRVYISNCAACHGQEGQGGVGPNLTDDYWLHGGHIKSIYGTIKNGVPEKGMIAWTITTGSTSAKTRN